MEITTSASMTKADLLRIDGIGEPTAAKLVADGITTKSELKTVLQEVAPLESSSRERTRSTPNPR